MPAPEIQISKDGLRLSYQRYLADSAAGFLVILIVLLAVNKGVPLPFLGHSLESLATLSKDTKIFIFLLLFFLATPLGLVINGLSWFSLGWLQVPINKKWFSLKDKWYNPLFPTKSEAYFDKMKDFFEIDINDNINNNHVSLVYSLYEDYLAFFFAERIRLEHVIGLSRFARNTAFIALSFFFSILHISCFSPDPCEIIHKAHPFLILTFLFALFAIVLYTLVEGLRYLQVFSTVYFLCIAHDITNDNPTEPEKLIEKIHAAYFA